MEINIFLFSIIGILLFCMSAETFFLPLLSKLPFNPTPLVPLVTRTVIIEKPITRLSVVSLLRSPDTSEGALKSGRKTEARKKNKDASRSRKEKSSVSKYDGSDDEKVLECSKLPCDSKTTMPICACNYNTGKVVTFKNKCDMEKHNCRFDTAFQSILDDICPWEFEMRTGFGNSIDYRTSKYHNL